MSLHSFISAVGEQQCLFKCSVHLDSDCGHILVSCRTPTYFSWTLTSIFFINDKQWGLELRWDRILNGFLVPSCHLCVVCAYVPCSEALAISFW